MFSELAARLPFGNGYFVTVITRPSEVRTSGASHLFVMHENIVEVRWRGAIDTVPDFMYGRKGNE
jgi:hypothetical protein